MSTTERHLECLSRTEGTDKAFVKEHIERTENTVELPPEAEPLTDSPGEKLRVIIANLPSHTVTLGEIRDLLGQDGLLLLTALLTIVFMIPVSIPGVSTVFGAAILLIGFSRLLNRSLWLPKYALDRLLPADRLHTGLNRGLVWFQRLERISRPRRLRYLTRGGVMGSINSFGLVAGAGLLMAPFGMIPFSNTLPALGLLFLALGLLQRDGVCILAGHLLNLATIAYFTFLLVGSGVAIHSILQRLV
jgi:hypothetical protein